ncbi:nuclear transport factor 2 family protein [Runella sp.]|uniref:nuclear transport factor 2 family protein n=1 Tax=Runella sp. TaxID=1960881 RepID=UPI003D124811
MKKLFPLLSIALLLSGRLLAQKTEEPLVREPIQQLFDGMKKSDSTLVRQSLMAGARLESIAKNKSGEMTVRSDSFEGFLKSIGKATPGDLDERLSAIEIRIDGDMATAWTPYKFYFKGNFSHCGVNAFQLVKTAAGWKIWSIIDTRRKEGCE